MSCADCYFLVFYFHSEFTKLKIWFSWTNGWPRKYNHSMGSWPWSLV